MSEGTGKKLSVSQQLLAIHGVAVAAMTSTRARTIYHTPSPQMIAAATGSNDSNWEEFR